MQFHTLNVKYLMSLDCLGCPLLTQLFKTGDASGCGWLQLNNFLGETLQTVSVGQLIHHFYPYLYLKLFVSEVFQFWDYEL